MIIIILIFLVSFGYCFLFNLIGLSPWFNFLWGPVSLILAFLTFIIFVLIFLAVNKKGKPTGKFRHKFLRQIDQMILIICNIRVKVIGSENIPNETFVCYANHKSNYDPLAIYYALNSICSAVGKKSLFDIPIIRQCQDVYGCISLDRDNDRAAAKSMVRAIKNIKEGLSYIIFPEGGIKNRDTEEMVNLRAGAYKLVTKTGALLLPCTILGSTKSSKRKSIFSRVSITLIFHKPISSEEYMHLNTTEIGKKVMDIINKDVAKSEKILK